MAEHKPPAILGLAKRPRILIADDDPDTRQILPDWLIHHGYETFVTADGEAALALAATHPLDLALLEVVMPGPGGMDLAQRLQALHPGLKVIIITAYGSVPDAVEALRRGAFDYLEKPLYPTRVLEVVQAALATPGPRTQVQAGELSVDMSEGRATLSGTPLALTPLEERLLLCLARRQEQLASHASLWREAWGYETPPDRSVIWMAVSRLRRKVGPMHIGCVRCQGYRLQMPASEEEEASAAGNC